MIWCFIVAWRTCSGRTSPCSAATRKWWPSSTALLPTQRSLLTWKVDATHAGKRNFSKGGHMPLNEKKWRKYEVFQINILSRNDPSNSISKNNVKIRNKVFVQLITFSFSFFLFVAFVPSFCYFLLCGFFLSFLFFVASVFFCLFFFFLFFFFVAFLYTCSCRIHIDAMIKTNARRLLYKYMSLSLYCKGSKRVTQGLRVRGSWKPNRNCNIFTSTLMAGNVVSFLFSWCSTGGPAAQLSTKWCLSLLYLISYFSGPQTASGFPRAPSAGCGFPYHISSNSISNSAATARRTQLSWLPSWLSYIIVQRLLDFWNRMFNRHQAEITVMQFRGHSLPVRQSIRVSWDFFACPILLANFRPRDFLSLLSLECLTSFRCITVYRILGRVEGQNITLSFFFLFASHWLIDWLIDRLISFFFLLFKKLLIIFVISHEIPITSLHYCKIISAHTLSLSLSLSLSLYIYIYI